MLLLYFIFVHITLLIPGYACIKFFGIFKEKPGIELSLAYLLSILFSAILAIIGYVADIPSILLTVTHWIVIAIGAYFFWRKKYYHDLLTHRFPLIALTLMTIFSCAFIGLSMNSTRAYIPDPTAIPGNNYDTLNVKVLNVAQTPANDNYIPYRQAQFMVNRSDPAKDSFIDEWGVHFFQRTPLLGAVTAQYFHLLKDTPPIAYTWSAASQDPHHTYEKFQIIAHIMNALFIIPAFYLISRLLGGKAARLAILFIIPSHFFLYNSFFSWPKSLVAFCILLSWLLLYERRIRYLIAAGIASGAAYLAHDLAILYVAASVLFLLISKRFRDIVIFGALHLPFFLPWYLASTLLYKKPSTFIYYPLSLHDIPQIAKKHEIIQEFLHTSPLRIIAIKLESLFYLLSPYHLIYSEGGQALGRRLWAFSIFTVPGSLGLGLIVPAVVGAYKRIKDLPFWIFALVPIIACTLIIGWPKGLGSLHFAQASVVLLIGLAAWWLSRPRRAIWLWIALTLNLIQTIIFGLYSYNFDTAMWLNTRDVCTLAVLGGVMALCAYASHLVYNDKKFPLSGWGSKPQKAPHRTLGQ